jgi:hypothetical protein
MRGSRARQPTLWVELRVGSNSIVLLDPAFEFGLSGNHALRSVERNAPAGADCAHSNPPSLQILDLVIPPFGLC